MAVWFLGPTKTTAPAAGCRGCSPTQRVLCPNRLTLTVGCGNCNQATLLAYRYLGALTCWPGMDHCNPNVCCPTMTLDPWVDFRSGLWVSSTVIQVFAECGDGGPQATTLQVTLSPVTVSKPITTGTSLICGATHVATITVFDDGTFAVT